MSKKPDGVRLVAVSLCIRRIIGEGWLKAIASDRLAEFFHPFQFGVGSGKGGESVAWAVKLVVVLVERCATCF